MKKNGRAFGSPINNRLNRIHVRLCRKEAMKWMVVTVIHLYEKQIGYCQGCRACMDTDLCTS